MGGDLAAILPFATGKKNPAFLEQKAAIDDLIGQTADSGAQTQEPRSVSYGVILIKAGCGGLITPRLVNLADFEGGELDTSHLEELERNQSYRRLQF